MNLKDIEKNTILLTKIKKVFDGQSHKNDVFDPASLDVTLPLLVDHYLSSLILNMNISKDKLIELHTDYIPGQIKKMAGLIAQFNHIDQQRIFMYLEEQYINNRDYQAQLTKFFNGNNRYKSDLMHYFPENQSLCMQ